MQDASTALFCAEQATTPHLATSPPAAYAPVLGCPRCRLSSLTLGLGLGLRHASAAKEGQHSAVGGWRSSIHVEQVHASSPGLLVCAEQKSISYLYLNQSSFEGTPGQGLPPKNSSVAKEAQRAFPRQFFEMVLHHRRADRSQRSRWAPPASLPVGKLERAQTQAKGRFPTCHLLRSPSPSTHPPSHPRSSRAGCSRGTAAGPVSIEGGPDGRNDLASGAGGHGPPALPCPTASKTVGCCEGHSKASIEMLQRAMLVWGGVGGGLQEALGKLRYVAHCRTQELACTCTAPSNEHAYLLA